ncbi:MAG: hypothetical protein JXA37_12870 [Chloroflexia bacterium]|nr:hypothetical protein [Chloroflexia bacterium]
MKRSLAITTLALILAGCSASGLTPAPESTRPIVPTARPTPTPVTGQPAVLSPSELKYRLIDEFGPVGAAGGIHYCDPDAWPVAADEETITQRAQERFAQIQADEETFAAIQQRLNLPPQEPYTDEQKWDVYHEYKALSAVQIEAHDGSYHFELGVYQDENEGPGGGAGFALSGSIDQQGQITVEKKEVSRFSCPRCLSGDTRIDMPGGPVPVRELRPGTLVWTLDREGRRRPAPILEVSRIPPPTGAPWAS